MKKLLFLILFLPFFAQAQWASGSFQRDVTTKMGRYLQGTQLDSLVFTNGTPVNGYVPVYNSTSKKTIWTNPSSFTTTLALGPIGSTPNANGLTLTGGTLNGEPASASFGGFVTTGTQTFAGAKTFSGSIFPNRILFSHLTNGRIVSGTTDFAINNSADAVNMFLINNSTYAATFAGSIGATNFSGSSSGTNTGDQTTITGNAATATALQNSRNFSTTGDVTGTSTAFNGAANVAIPTTVTKVNGVAFSGLATGILKNTTGTGVPSIAVANTDYLPVASPTATGTLTVPIATLNLGASPTANQLNVSANNVVGLTGFTSAADNSALGFDVDYSSGFRAKHATGAMIYKNADVLDIDGSGGNTPGGVFTATNRFRLNLTTGAITIPGAFSNTNLSAGGVIKAAVTTGLLSIATAGTDYLTTLTGAITSSGNTTSLGSFTSANLSTALTDETGSGATVFANTPTLVTPVIGAATGTSVNLSSTATASSFQGTNGTSNFVRGSQTVTINPNVALGNTSADISTGENKELSFSINSGGTPVKSISLAPTSGNVTMNGTTTLTRSSQSVVINPNPGLANTSSDISTDGAKNLSLSVNSSGSAIKAVDISGSTGGVTLVGTLGINGTANNITSGTYTPTATNVTGTSAITARVTNYSRIGNIVHVGGSITVTGTSGACILRMSLPIASDFTLSTDCSGVGNGDNSATTGTIVSTDTTNNEAQLAWTGVGASGGTVFYQYDYIVK